MNAKLEIVMFAENDIITTSGEGTFDDGEMHTEPGSQDVGGLFG